MKSQTICPPLYCHRTGRVVVDGIDDSDLLAIIDLQKPARKLIGHAYNGEPVYLERVTIGPVGATKEERCDDGTLLDLTRSGRRHQRILVEQNDKPARVEMYREIVERDGEIGDNWLTELLPTDTQPE